MNKIDKDFVYNRFPKTGHDIKLYEDYKAFISLKCKTGAKNDLEEQLSLFPVYEGTENANDVFALTRFGFMALSIDDDFMNTASVPWLPPRKWPSGRRSIPDSIGLPSTASPSVWGGNTA